MEGGGEIDFLHGGVDNDELHGGPEGGNTLNGSSGKDTLISCERTTNLLVAASQPFRDRWWTTTRVRSLGCRARTLRWRGGGRGRSRRAARRNRSCVE
jgi:hypothetical protein